MSDITITNGLPADSPWTLANSDATKLDKANLINLAVGQLALLGASQGQTLQAQTGVLKELIGGVDKVNAQLDLLSGVNSSPSSWSGKSVDFGFPDASIGLSVSPQLLATPSLLNQMINATTEMRSQGVTPRSYDGYSFSLNSPKLVLNGSETMVSKEIAKAFSRISGLPAILGLYDVNYDLQGIQLGFNNGQLLNVRDATGSALYVLKDNIYYKTDGSGTDKVTLDLLKGFNVPLSKEELFNWELQAKQTVSQPYNPKGLSSGELSIKNTFYLDAENIILAPNTLPVSNPPVPNSLSNAVTMKIDNTKTYDMAKYQFFFDIPDAYAIYPPIPSKNIVSADLIPANVGKVFQTETQGWQYVYKNEQGRIVNATIKLHLPFFYNPKSELITNWKSQYAEKIIVITQRSSDQQLFVNNLAQKYQYAFDAATYVLKAFTAMLSSAANNV
jgi:hypothetical protein